MIFYFSLILIILLKIASVFSEVSNGLHFLNEESFLTKISEGDYFVKFFSPSDTHSKKLTPIWKQLAQKYEKSENVKIAEFDCSVAGSFCKDIGIKGFPALIYHRNGNLLNIHKGSKDLKSLEDFVESMLNEGGKDEF